MSTGNQIEKVTMLMYIKDVPKWFLYFDRHILGYILACDYIFEIDRNSKKFLTTLKRVDYFQVFGL